MQPIQTDIPDVIIIQPQIFGDQRGFFLETYNAKLFAALGITKPFVQDNHSGSFQGALRGLHYQLNQPQGKLIRVIVGEIYDVAVDLRRNSATFGKWVGVRLSAETKHQLWVPPGFAHGFYTLSDWAEVLYKVTDFYAPDWERTILWNDPDVGVNWPIPPESEPVLSEKDIKGVLFKDAVYYEEME
jgi:dTDP-4-dehydrorhamnose 3,5-epimerase